MQNETEKILSMLRFEPGQTTDAFSKYAELVAIDNKTAPNVARCFLKGGYAALARPWKLSVTMDWNFAMQ